MLIKVSLNQVKLKWRLTVKGQSNLSPKSSQNSKRKTSLSKKLAAEGTIASATGSSGTASKSVSEGRDEQDDEQSVKEKPFGGNKNKVSSRSTA